MLQIVFFLVFMAAWAAPARAADAPPAEAIEWIFESDKDEGLLDVGQPDMVMPDDISRALQLYAAGEYRRAAFILDRLRSLQLPDGRLDFISFALGECYRMLGVEDAAVESYTFVTQRFPVSDKAPAAAYRLLDYACKDTNAAAVDSILGVFRNTLQKHALYPSVLYLAGKFYYRERRFNEAVQVLGEIPRNSARSAQAQYLSALSLLGLNNRDKAMLLLDYVRQNAGDIALSSEATIVIGDLLYAQGNPEKALKYYLTVGEQAPRWDYALIKSVRCQLDLKLFKKARDVAQEFVLSRSGGRYYFEMMSLLEEAFRGTGQTESAAKTGAAVFREASNARISFWVYEELARLMSMSQSWREIQYDALARQDKVNQSVARDQLSRLQTLERRNWELVSHLDGTNAFDIAQASANLAVRRYLGILKDSVTALEGKVLKARDTIANLSAPTQPSALDSLTGIDLARVSQFEDSATKVISRLERERMVVMREFRDRSGGVLEGDGPAKFIDWAFERYQGKKDELVQARMQSRKDTAAVQRTDSTAAGGKQAARIFSAVDGDRLALEITEDRTQLIKHIETMLEYYPRNKHNPPILFRLAELYYDEASSDFDQRLEAYEKTLASGAAPAGLKFPEYDLSKTLAMYDRIVEGYPTSEVADDAMFYKAVALQKLGDYDRAVDVLLQLVKKYPEGEFFAEANMVIGRYYFERPQVKGNTGYKLAEDAFREVLYFRDHPQFVQALYNLGWCYYMQDRYEEAIAVFKYLIEEVDLNFDPGRTDQEQVVNPLLRGEAIDYIAISFDEKGKTDEAVAFLQLVGNPDYAALVLKRIGELREEVQDNAQALAVYARLLSEYPNALIAPEVAAHRIRLLDNTGATAQALEEREAFFTRFARTSPWAKAVGTRDSTRLVLADSMAIANGLYVGDYFFRKGQSSRDSVDFAGAARNYAMVVKAYPADPRAIDARWNLAVILDQNLNKRKEAFAQYMACSRAPGVPEQRREEAALNAIALVQRALPPDSLVEEGKLEPAAVRLTEAVNNYIELFPEGKSQTDVLLALGSVYFNRKMYANAAKVYDQIIKKGPTSESYYQALFLLGQARFAEESWPEASKAFEEVAGKSADSQRREEARKLLLQSEYLHAKQFLASGDFANAAAALLSVDERFPGSQYGDVVLFSAAEAFEKIEKWNEACAAYHRLVQSYGTSKLAPEALFNAASIYEKTTKLDKAIESYELLTSQYGSSDKAKDALFNLGFCYEKLGKIDMMVEVNERYTALYPGEKDAKAMLLRSAGFYFKTKQYEKAQNVYRNFHRRYGTEPQSVEAVFMIGRTFQELGDRVNAVSSFSQAEQQHQRLVQAGGEGNTYFAAEAAFASATLLRGDFDGLDFGQSGVKVKDMELKKSLAMTEAARAYTRVVQYQSERMFEAAFRIGEMFENFSGSWVAQKRDATDPVKAAVAERDIQAAASALLQKSFVPYKKVLEMAKKFDSLKTEQKKWTDTTRAHLQKCYFKAGEAAVASVAAMSSAPVPKEIYKKPLHYFQYFKQLAETLEPMKLSTCAYYLSAYEDMVGLGLDGEAVRSILDRYCQLTYLMGLDFEKIAERILKNDFERPANETSQEREDLDFQLEDILFEIQDKALFVFEDARKRILDAGASDSPWLIKIGESLARLNPDKYGKSVFATVVVMSGTDWLVRGDSAVNWRDTTPQSGEWRQAAMVDGLVAPAFAGGQPSVLWSDQSNADSVFIRKDVLVNGQPRNASLRLAATCKFFMYVNGTLATSDSVGASNVMKVDSFTNITPLFHAGRNVVAIRAWRTSTVPGVAVQLSFLVDMTGTSSGTTSPAAVAAGTPARGDTASQQGTGSAAGAPASGSLMERLARRSTRVAEPRGWEEQNVGSRDDVLRSAEDYGTRAANTEREIRRERVEMQKIQIRSEYLDANLKGVQDELAGLRKELEQSQKK